MKKGTRRQKRITEESNRMETPAVAEPEMEKREDNQFRDATKLMEAGNEPPSAEKRPVWQGQPAKYDSGVCPNCGSSRNVIVKTYAADMTTRGGAYLHRLHVCHNCGTRFRSIQLLNAVDVGYVRMSKIPEVTF